MAGISLQEIKEILPTNLLTGYGEKVCMFLNLLADRALTARQINGRPLSYPREDEAVQQEGLVGYGLQEEEVWIIIEFFSFFIILLFFVVEKELIEEDNLEVPQEDELFHHTTDRESDSTGPDTWAHSIVMPTADPALWREETERVGSMLVAAKKKIISGSTWYENVASLQAGSKYWQQRAKDPGEDNNNNNKGNTKGKAEDDSILQLVSELLENESRVLKEEISSVDRGEKMVNSKLYNAELTKEFTQHKMVSLNTMPEKQNKS